MKGSSSSKNNEKVGSDRKAAAHVGGKNDFGKPVHQPNVVRINEDDPIDRPAGSALGVGLDPGRRTAGVGAIDSGDGASSGGDLDPDFVGIAGGAGLAQSAGGHVTEGPSSTTGKSDEFASGKHAKGRNAIPKGTVGSGGPVKGSSTLSEPDARTGRQEASEGQYDPQDTE